MQKKKTMTKIILKNSQGKSKVREYEIERVTDLLQDPTVRDIEKFGLNIYLKSLIKENGKQK